MAGLARRLRCLLTGPLGHAYELVEYVDPLSRRWAAQARCVRCGKDTGLAVGEARHGAIFVTNPLATMLTRQGVKRSAPPSATAREPIERPAALVVSGPAGEDVALDRVRVFLAGRRPRELYWAWVHGRTPLPVLHPRLEGAVAAALGSTPDPAWLARLTGSLEGELPIRR